MVSYPLYPGMMANMICFHLVLHQPLPQALPKTYIAIIEERGDDDNCTSNCRAVVLFAGLLAMVLTGFSCQRGAVLPNASPKGAFFIPGEYRALAR